LWRCAAAVSALGLRVVCFGGFCPMPFLSFVSAPAPVASAPAPVSLGSLLGSASGGVPASYTVFGRSVLASGLRPVASGRVSGVSVVRSAAGAPVAVVCFVGGVRFRCNRAGFASAADSAGVLAALRSAEAAGSPVELLGAPNRSGAVLPGYFCGVR